MQCPTCGKNTPGTLGRCVLCNAPLVGGAALEGTVIDPLAAPVPSATAESWSSSGSALGQSWDPQAQGPARDSEATQAWTLPADPEPEPAQESIIPDSWFAEPRQPDPGEATQRFDPPQDPEATALDQWTPGGSGPGWSPQPPAPNQTALLDTSHSDPGMPRPPGAQFPGDPIPGGHMNGGPTQGNPMNGGPMPGDPLHGGPMPADPMYGGPMPSGPVPGGPMDGGPMPGAPMDGGPMPGGHMPGGPAPEGSMYGGPMHGGPVPAGPMPGGPMGVETMPGGPGGPGGPYPGEPQYRPSGGRSNKPLVIAVAGLVAVALVAVGIVFWSERGGDSAPAASSASPSKGRPVKQGGPAGPARRQAQAVHVLLNASAATRNQLGRALNAAKSCQTLPTAIQGFQQVAQRRTNQINRTNALKVGALNRGEQLRVALRRSFQLSLQTDQAFLAWAQRAQARNCRRAPRPDSNYQRGQTLSVQATNAKQQVIALWNPIAKKVNLPTRTNRQF